MRPRYARWRSTVDYPTSHPHRLDRTWIPPLPSTKRYALHRRSLLINVFQGTYDYVPGHFYTICQVKGVAIL